MIKKTEIFALITQICVVFGSFFFILTGCSNSISSVLDEYNGNFTPSKDEIIRPKPGDVDFDETQMLFSSYYICSDGSVNLSAPESKTYLWRMFDSKSNEVTSSLSFYDESGSEKREFRFYIPDASPALAPGSYQITLVVTDDVDTAYSDSATLVVYEKIK